MIKKNNKEVGFIKKGNKKIDRIYKNNKLVFEQGFLREDSGSIPLSTSHKAIGKDLKNYQIYGNSIQDGTPTPSNPAEVESVGNKTRNVFNINSVSVVSAYNAKRFGEEGKTYTVSITDKDTSVDISKCYLAVSDGAKYVEHQSNFNYLILNGVIREREMVSVTDKDQYYLAVYPNTKDTWDKLNARFNIMIAEGSNVCPYEPYGYKILISIRGKNFLPDDLDMFIMDSYRHYKLSETSKKLRITLIDKDTSIDVSGISFGFTRNGRNANDGFNWVVASGIIQTKSYRYLNTRSWKDEIVEPMMYFSFHPRTNETWERINARWYIQVEEGEVKTDYEPYIEPTSSVIYLSEPLHKVEDYADYIDFKNRKIIRKIGKDTFNGSEIWYFNTENGNGRVYTTKLLNLNNKQNVVMCTIYARASGMPYYPPLNMCGINGYGIFIVGVDPSVITSVNDYKTWLAENNYDVYFALAEQTEEEIDLPTIPSLKGTTIYSFDTETQPSSLYVQYKGK